MRVITRNEMAWDKSHEQYVTTYQESYDFGYTDVDECKGGGAKGIIGLVAAIAIPFAAPAIAAGLQISTTIGTALVGAGLGGAVGLATGGLKGGLLGAIGGGLGGYFNAASNPLIGTAGNVASGAGLSTAVPGSGVSAFTEGGVGVGSVGAVSSSAAAPLAGDLSAGLASGLSSSANIAADGTPLLATGGNGSVSGFLSGGAGGGTAAPSIFDNLSPNVQEAGLKLGTQLLGNALTPTPQGTGLEAQAAYLNKLQGQSDQAFGANVTQNTARNKDASAVETIAANYDPQYLGNNAETISKNRDAAGWAEAEARLRTQGYSQQAIDAEHNRYNTQASQNAGTAYTGGVAQGTSQQAGLYTQGAGIRQDLNAPSDGLSSAYSALATQTTNKQAAAGKAIQDITGVFTPEPTIGAKKTANTNIAPVTQ